MPHRCADGAQREQTGGHRRFSVSALFACSARTGECSTVERHETRGSGAKCRFVAAPSTVPTVGGDCSVLHCVLTPEARREAAKVAMLGSRPAQSGHATHSGHPPSIAHCGQSSWRLQFALHSFVRCCRAAAPRLPAHFATRTVFSVEPSRRRLNPASQPSEQPSEEERKKGRGEEREAREGEGRCNARIEQAGCTRVASR